MSDDAVADRFERLVERRVLVYWLIVLVLPALTFLEMIGIGGLWFSDADDGEYGVVESLAASAGSLLVCLIAIGGAELAIRRRVSRSSTPDRR